MRNTRYRLCFGRLMRSRSTTLYHYCRRSFCITYAFVARYRVDQILLQTVINCHRDKMEPSKVSEKARLFFQKQGDEFPCTVSENCSYRPKKVIIANCIRHIRDQHPEEYNILNLGKRLSEEEIQTSLLKKRSRIASTNDESHLVRINRQKVVGGLLKVVAFHDCGFKSMEWEGIRDIVDPILESFKITINRHNVGELLRRTCAGMEESIKQEVAGQMLAFKFDMTTKMNRSVLGVSCQFYKEVKLINRCLGKYSELITQLGQIEQLGLVRIPTF